MLFLKTIEPQILSLLQRLQALPELADTRLVGGTALALQLGHRISVDLDVFGKWDYSKDLCAHDDSFQLEQRKRENPSSHSRLHKYRRLNNMPAFGVSLNRIT